MGNGFLFLLFCGLLFKNCFIEFLFLLGKSLFAFYTIADLIYVILLIRKHCYFFIKLCYYLSFNLAVLFMLIKFNNTLNFYLKSKANIKFKINSGTYEGNRHRLGYPVRSQRSLSNGKSQKRLHKSRLYFKINKYYFRKNIPKI